MVIESRTMVGVAGACAIVGAGLWLSLSLATPPQHAGTVEVQQIEERSWAVEIKDLGTNTNTATAANR